MIDTDLDYLSGAETVLQRIFAYHAADHGDRTWCTFEGKSYTYRDIDADANRLAHALRDELEVGRGTR